MCEVEGELVHGSREPCAGKKRCERALRLCLPAANRGEVQLLLE